MNVAPSPARARCAARSSAPNHCHQIETIHNASRYCVAVGLAGQRLSWRVVRHTPVQSILIVDADENYWQTPQPDERKSLVEGSSGGGAIAESDCSQLTRLVKPSGEAQPSYNWQSGADDAGGRHHSQFGSGHVHRPSFAPDSPSRLPMISAKINGSDTPQATRSPRAR